MNTQERMITVAELTLMKEQRGALWAALYRLHAHASVAYREHSVQGDHHGLKMALDGAQSVLDSVSEMEASWTPDSGS